jgi:hypothetical protein
MRETWSRYFRRERQVREIETLMRTAAAEGGEHRDTAPALRLPLPPRTAARLLLLAAKRAGTGIFAKPSKEEQ